MMLRVSDPPESVVDAPSGAVRRVVLIDPRQERRAVTLGLLERTTLLDVVGVAGTLSEAERQIRDEAADAALLEIQMPVVEGLATIRALRARFRHLRIVVCSFHDDATTRSAARRYGADAYVTKPVQIDDLVALIVGPPTSSGADLPLAAPAHDDPAVRDPSALTSALLAIAVRIDELWVAAVAGRDDALSSHLEDARRSLELAMASRASPAASAAT